MLAKGFWFHASGLLNSNIIRSPGMTPNFTAHYRELTWILIWFHFVPQVGKDPEIPAHDFGVKVRLAQKTLEKFLWFSSWHKSLPFLSQANKSKGATIPV